MRVALTMAMMAAVLLPGLPGQAQSRELLGIFTADSEGRISGSVEIPDDTTPGRYDLVASGTAGPTESAESGDSDSGYGGEQLLVDDTTVEPGQEVEIESGGWAPGTQVRVTLEPASQSSAFGGLLGGGVAYAQVNREVSARIRVVADSSSGGGITSGGSTTSGGTTSTTGNTSNTNTGSTSTPARAGSLARTGLTVMPWLVAAGAALGIGAIFLLASRRNRRGQNGSEGLPQV